MISARIANYSKRAESFRMIRFFCSKRQREKGTRMYKFMLLQADIQKLYHFWGKKNMQRSIVNGMKSEKKTTAMNQLPKEFLHPLRCNWGCGFGNFLGLLQPLSRTPLDAGRRGPLNIRMLPCSLICLYKPHPPQKKVTWTSNTTITQKKTHFLTALS